MRIQPLSVESICFICDNLSHRSMLEAQVFGMSVKQMEEKFLGMIDQPFGVVFSNDEGVPCVVVVLTPTRPGEWRTNFAATEDGLEEIGFGITRFLKNFTDDMVKRNNHIEAWTAIIDSRAQRWFHSMGFECHGSKGKAYRYVKEGDDHVYGRQ
jgi:hypothetical protein